MSKGASALREASSELNNTSLSTTSTQDLNPASQEVSKALEGLYLGSAFRIIKFLRTENHGDVYLLVGNLDSERTKKCYYVAKAIDFGGSCASKLQAHRQKHLKRLKASSSFVCVVEEHGLKWMIRNSEERCAPVIGVASGPEFVELDRIRSGGPLPVNVDLASESHFTDIGANDDDSASQASRQCSKTDVDLPPDGTRDGYSIPESYTTKDESQPALDEGDNIVVNQKVQQQPDVFECAGDASVPAAAADAGRDSSEGIASDEDTTSQEQRREVRKQTGKSQWRKIQREKRRMNKLECVASLRSILQPRTAPVQLLIPR
ncbi:uncharacterized protein A1O5_00402 [Cladophialophora psammophila CBS 110553]|uniref:Uncharacterized protein n=1 Tax=Cladophialophora psammophila CBS 110553 TaxID=1182543 RepID=W9Y083_9EURO|nr:uncharacterized protein A1O5_00402 [Cladophialophora psammophila CBS 110553]EXJ75894.1 hypothetical protein A1O5_00402 [Cladophialophora psammophila CBS 110553]